MRKWIIMAATCALAACAKPMDPKVLKPDARMGVVSLNSPYFYAASTGMLRPANKFAQINIESWRLGDAITATISQTIAGCSRITMVPVVYDGAALMEQYALPQHTLQNKGVLEDLLLGDRQQEYDFSKVKPSLLQLMQTYQLDYLYVAKEMHAYGQYQMAFMRGTTGLHYDPNVARLTLYFRSAASILDRSGQEIASSPVNNSMQMVPESSYAFQWKDDARQYTEQDFQLFRRAAVDLMRQEFGTQISSIGLCNRRA